MYCFILFKTMQLTHFTIKNYSMKQLLYIAAIALFTSCSNRITPSTTPIVNTEVLNNQNQPILLGHCSLDALQQKTYVDWYNKNYTSYQFDSSVILQLQTKMNNYTIEIFLGTWCGDSKREVPRMMKVLQAAQIDTGNIRLIFVSNNSNAYKQSPQQEQLNKFIHRVPTFIVYKNNKEVNRIVELPVETLEKDLLQIVNQQPYSSNYKAAKQWYSFNQKNKILSDTTLKLWANKHKHLCKNAAELNALGYVLLAEKKFTQALNVFTVNSFIYPQNANVYDSLAEAYELIGNKVKAIENYKKVLVITPNNEAVKNKITQLQQ